MVHKESNAATRKFHTLNAMLAFKVVSKETQLLEIFTLRKTRAFSKESNCHLDNAYSQINMCPVLKVGITLVEVRHNHNYRIKGELFP